MGVNRCNMLFGQVRAGIGWRTVGGLGSPGSVIAP